MEGESGRNINGASSLAFLVLLYLLVSVSFLSGVVKKTMNDSQRQNGKKKSCINNFFQKWRGLESNQSSSVYPQATN